MLNAKLGLTSSLLLVSSVAITQSEHPVIYGVDNRAEVYEASEAMQRVAASTAAMISLAKMTERNLDGQVSYTANQKKLKEDGVCEDDRYAEQVAPADCSGFLVGPDLLVTAGHCVRAESDCQSNLWVFGFNLNQATQSAGIDIPASQVYRCKNIINQKLDGDNGADHALIQLDRVVQGVRPLRVRTEGRIAEGTQIVVMGHPMGLPTKIADGAWVRSNEEEHYFVANLDTFGGNSGSAVFNTQDFTVEGLLVRGETDYEFNPEKGCMEVFKCDDDACRGEDVTRITDVFELAQRELVIAAASGGELTKVSEYLAAGGWVNLYDNAGVSILAHAAAEEKIDIVKVLIEKSVDVNAKDLMGASVLHRVSGRKNATSASQQVIVALVAAGARINETDGTGNSALHAAVQANNTKAVEVLLNQGIDVRLTNAEGKTAYQLTRWYNLKQRKIRKLLRRAMRTKA